MKEPGFRVVIVGGGIGGLALANSLQHAGIDYILIEKSDRLDPQVGASIGILPNGARILDQIGCFDDILSQTVHMETTASHNADGSLIGGISDTLNLMRARTGYPVTFIDRQLLLRALAGRISDPDRIWLSKKVQSVDQDDDEVVVTLADGTILKADIVVGADGVHSSVRREMWRHAEIKGEGDKFTGDKTAMTAGYKCLFGISSSISGMEPGQTDRTYASGLSTLSYVGKEGRVFWFVFAKMDQEYCPPNIPKFTEDDVNAMMEQHANLAIREGRKVTLADLYRNRICSNLVPLEEADFQHWSYGRLVCLGDSIHKMTPNLGAGASCAMESAAVLSNVIVGLASRSVKPSPFDIRSALERYQQHRALRVTRAMNITNKLTRLQALETKKDYVFARYIGPLMDDYYAEVFSSFVIGAPTINHLQIPERSLQGTMPFNPKQGWGFEEPMRARLSRALPLIALVLLCLPRTSQYLGWPDQVATTGWFGLKALPTEHQAQAARQDLALSIHSAAIYGLWLMESARLANKATLLQLPILFGLSWQFLGFRATLPLYLFFLYVQSPVEKFRALDMRLTDVSYTYTVGPLVFLLSMLPKCLTYSFPNRGDSGGSSIINLAYWITQSQLLLPLALLSAGQLLFARLLRKSTIQSDRIWAVDRDVTSIRCTSGFFITLTSLAWINHLMGSTSMWSQGVAATPPSLHMLLPDILGWDGVFVALSAAIWFTLVIRDLRHASMMTMADCGWFTVLSVTTLVLLGPGSMFVFGWQWREEILLKRRHRDAVIG